MSTCLSGAAAYRLESLDIEMIKSAPSTTSWISSSSSPSSAVSDSSPLAISTRKPRTPRKRPNQVSGEAAALLSTAYPKLFPPANIKFSNPSFPFEPSPDLLVQVAGFSPRRPNCVVPFLKACRSPTEEMDFDAESIVLDEEVAGGGIDCIMGDFSDYGLRSEFCYGYPVGLGFEAGEIGMRKGAREIRDGGEDGDWWRFPSVSAADLNQKPAKSEKRKKKKKVSEIRDPGVEEEIAPPRPNGGLLLKLDYDSVLNAWSEKASPFSGDKVAGGDVQVRLAQINLFPEKGGTREASVLRYKEKKRNRLFSKKITYHVRKVNADQRPRMKGRFVRTRDSDD